MPGEERDTFQLQPVLYPALPLDASINPASPAALNRSIRCAEPFGSHLYVGSSDGQVFCFVQPPVENGSQEADDFRHVGTRDISTKPIDRILVLAPLAIAAVLSEATLTFHELPSFLPVPVQVLPHTKGVSSVVLDDEEISRSWGEKGGVDDEGLLNLCIVRRKAIMLVKVGVDTWRVIKEIPLPGGATVARRSGSSLCLSTTTEYNMVDLQGATMSGIGLPISQTGDAPSASNRPCIVSIASGQQGQCEFVITSHSKDSTLGVFVGQLGEPTAKLLEWPSHPRALALDYPYLHALLRNDSIEIHNVATMEKVQTLHLPPLLEPRTLSLATSALAIMEAGQAQVSLVQVRLMQGGKRARMELAKEPSWREKALEDRKTRSKVLLIGKNAVQCLCTTRALDTAKKALQRGDYERVKRAIDGASLRSDEAVELEYMNQMVAIHCLRMLRFEDARKHILRGRLDPRVVLHLFPDLLDGVWIDEPVVELFADVKNGLDELGSLESLPSLNLQLNYSPPLDVSTDEVLHQLLDKLNRRLHRFLRNLLNDLRGQESTLTRREVDSSLAKVMILQGDKEALAQFLLQDNECDMALVEPHLEGMGCFAALLAVRQGKEDWKGAFDLHTRLLDGELTDATFTGSLQDLVKLLEQCPDAELVHQYALWLIQRDADAGIKLLGKPSKSRSSQSTLDELRALDDRAADAFLENTALSKKQHTAEAHMELAQLLLKRLSTALAEEKERKLMEEVCEDYTRGEYAESFVAHMALRWDQTATIVHRLKLVMLLQSSQVLDVERVLGWVRQQPMLVFEEAILLGKLHRDAEALELLAIQLHDANSSEIYCNQNRFALSSVQMHSLAVEQKGLVLYANFYAKSLKRVTANRDSRVKLLKVLLQVYMEKGASNETQVATSHLLNTQSLNLSPHEVLLLVPPHWSLSSLETFLSRSLRKEMHMSNEGQIKRSVALAQNLQVSESLWAKRRGLGGVIEDGTEGGGAAAERRTDEAGEMAAGQTLLEKAEKSSVVELGEGE